eukprot:jgi/Mesvir1/1528/Mv14511-RA.1
MRGSPPADAAFQAPMESIGAVPTVSGGGLLSFAGSVGGGGSDVGDMEGIGAFQGGGGHLVGAGTVSAAGPSAEPTNTFNAYAAPSSSKKKPQDFVVHASIVGVCVALSIVKFGPVYNPDLFTDHGTGVIDKKKLNMGAAIGGVVAALMTAFVLSRFG